MPVLIEWMNEKQRDPRLNEMLYPSYTEKRCMEIIMRYEKSEENQAASKWAITTIDRYVYTSTSTTYVHVLVLATHPGVEMSSLM